MLCRQRSIKAGPTETSLARTIVPRCQSRFLARGLLYFATVIHRRAREHSAMFRATQICEHAVIMTGMKLLTEYLERAVSLERLAAGEQDSKFKNELIHQAAAYRKLAAKRPNKYGLPPPSPPEIPPKGIT